jgi:hypothetical protein
VTRYRIKCRTPRDKTFVQHLYREGQTYATRDEAELALATWPHRDSRGVYWVEELDVERGET